MMRKRRFLCAASAVLFLFPSLLWAGAATLQWQANPETDLKEYKIYHGTASRSYGTPLPVGKLTSYTFDNLAEGVTHYFAVTAVDTYNNESGYSSEVTKSVSVSDSQAPQVVINSPTPNGSYATSEASVNLAGSASDNQGVIQVTWSKSGGGSGTASGTSNWSVSGISLSEGQNTISVFAKDGAGNQGTAVITVTYTPPSAGDAQPPQIAITSPTTGLSYTTSSSSIGLAGNASADAGIKQVTWSNASGGSGTAYGTTNWSVRRIKLTSGENKITVVAEDAAGNQSTDEITVTYAPRSSWSSRWWR